MSDTDAMSTPPTWDAADMGALGCGAAASPPEIRPVLAVGMDGAVVLVLSDGTTQPLFDFRPYPEGRDTVGLGLLQRGGYLLAVASSWLPTDTADCEWNDSFTLLECPEWNRAVLLDLDGRVLWSKIYAASTLSSQYGLNGWLSADGSVALHGIVAQVLLERSGRETPLPDLDPIDLFDGPSLLASFYDAVESRASLGWFRPDGDIELTGFTADGDRAFFGDDFVAMPARDGDGAAHIVWARADGVESRRASPEVLESFVGSGPYRMLVAGDEVVRTNLVSGTTERFPLVMPVGMTLFGQIWPQRDIASNGDLIIVARDEHAARALASPNGEDWSPVGLPVADIDIIALREVGGTFSIDTTTTIVPTEEWSGLDPPDGAAVLRGRSTQLARPIDGFATEIEHQYDPVTISRDGACVAYQRDGHLVVHDVVRDVSNPVLRFTTSSRSVLWLDR